MRTNLSSVFDAMQGLLENGAYLLIIPWVLLASFAALRNRELPPPVAYFGMVAAMVTLIGVSGIVPELESLPGTLWLLSVGVVLRVRPIPALSAAPRIPAAPAAA